MSALHVYLKPFDTSGSYISDWQEVTKDVDLSGIGDLTQQLDNTEYDLGIFRNSNVRLKMRNDHGKYAKAGEIGSIFDYKRADTQVKITWEPGDYKLICGFFKCGESRLSKEIDIFKGLLDDKAAKSAAEKQDVQFNALGREVLFERVTVPIGSISNGDSFESVLYTILNQTEITGLLTVDAGNISVSSNENIDDKTAIENKTVLEALKEILLPANAVLYIKDDTIHIAPRTAGASLKYTFYGQASDNGTENVSDITDYRSGYNRIFNYWTWKDTTEKSSNASSITTYGTSKKEIGTDLISTGSTSKIGNILDDLRDEFKDPKEELRLQTPINVDRLDIFLLDRISVDYPTLVLTSENETIPIYGVATYGDGTYPLELFSVIISASSRFKVLSRKVSFKNETIEFLLREI